MKILSIEDIAVDTAKEMISHNESNRPLNKAYIKQLVNDMKNGAFQDNGQSISFDEDGRLLDGQHRLSAVIESGIVWKGAVVVRGLKPETFATIDSGRQRSTAERLSAIGVKDARSIGACARTYLFYKSGDFSYNGRFSDIEILKLIEKNSELFYRAQSLARELNKAVRGQPGVYAGHLALALDYDGEQTEEFCRGVVSGAELKDGDPRLAFRRYMLNALVLQKKLDRATTGEMLRQALNAWLYKPRKTITALHYKKGMGFTPFFFAPVQVKSRAHKTMLLPLLEDVEKRGTQELQKEKTE